MADEACVLWCLAIDHAMRTGELDVRVGLPYVSEMWPGHCSRRGGVAAAPCPSPWRRQLRAEGRTVLLHRVHASPRTPIVAAAYGALVTGGSEREALRRVQAVLPPVG